MIVWRNVRRYRMLLIRRVVPHLMCVPLHLCVCLHVCVCACDKCLWFSVSFWQRRMWTAASLVPLSPPLPFTGFSFLSSQSPFVTRQFPRYFSSYIISPTDTQIYNLTHNQQQQQQQQQGQRQPRHMQFSRFSRFSRFPRRMAASFALSMSRHKTEVSSWFFLLTAACRLPAACGMHQWQEGE